MITAEALSGVIAGYLTEKGLFLVDIEISKDNDITIAVESSEGDVKIENCVDIDHIVSGVFDRDVEDYSLTVTSAGLDQPFKVLQQYRKFVGNEVEVVVKGGGKMKGIVEHYAKGEFVLDRPEVVISEKFLKLNIESIIWLLFLLTKR